MELDSMGISTSSSIHKVLTPGYHIKLGHPSSGTYLQLLKVTYIEFKTSFQMPRVNPHSGTALEGLKAKSQFRGSKPYFHLIQSKDPDDPRLSDQSRFGSRNEKGFRRKPLYHPKVRKNTRFWVRYLH